ncbi:cysteine desulfurase-like protein [Daejeonella oryzae]|uniref:cysteine desulfurase-like protein n=1 Tax=Daejeonella oryzae TaxID=1122943 RepID=UPI00040E8DFD|nr:cysteine desulfurase-like protein [Daejeonella oryzae]
MDLEFVRKQFPALDKEFVFMDNAGGSQVLSRVANKITDYLINSNVQLGASYKVSVEAGEKLINATDMVADYINASDSREVVIGPSSTMLFRILSISLSHQWKEGDEVIVSNSDHEANVSCWTDLEDKGIVIKIWKINPQTFEFEIEDLKALFSDRTNLVAMVHTSNVLGTINPIEEICSIVHKAGALFCVDGVAYAPHRLVDVQKWNVDFYVFSWYKVYGPHLAVMFGKLHLLQNMKGINHYFIKDDDVPYKFQPGNYNFELTYSLTGITDYLNAFYEHHYPDYPLKNNREKYQKCFELISIHEEKLSAVLLSYLNTNSKIRVIGKTDADYKKRVPTISFVHQDLKSSDIVLQVDKFNIGIRFGDFYAKKLIGDLDLNDKDGVVRVSLAHYNSLDEVNDLIKALKSILVD